MHSDEINHTADHERLIRQLVEEELSGEAQRRAEAYLLSCDQCLGEYNRYRRFWRAATDPQAFAHWGTRLRDRQPEQYAQYQRAIDGLQDDVRGEDRPATAGAEPPGAWRLPSAWRKLALALAALLLLVLSVGWYRLVSLQRAVQREQAQVQTLLAEKAHDKKGERLAAMEKQMEALNRKVDELGLQNRGQAERADGFRRRLEKYVKPRVNVVLSLPFNTTRRPGDVARIEWPKDKLLLNFQVRVPEDTAYKTYRFVIADHRGPVLWQADGIRRDELGNFNLLFGRDFLPDGDYVLSVYGRDGRQRSLVSQLRFRIVAGS